MNERLKSADSTGREFELVIKEILEYNNFKNVEYNVKNIIDISADFENRKYIFEIKIYRNNYKNYELLKRAAFSLKTVYQNLKKEKKETLPILILGIDLSDKDKNNLEKKYNISIWDLKNLLYLIDNNEIIKQKLISLLDFSVNDVKPKKPKKPEKIADKFLNESSIVKDYEGERLIEELSKIKLEKNLENETKESEAYWRKYENLCSNVLKYLFNDELQNKINWNEQKTSWEGMFRFDMICSIKTNGKKSYFWEMIERYFNSKFILFEFKYRTEKINQNDVYITSKYLYSKAFRSVAILISNKEPDNNAKKTSEGLLREDGKLILIIQNKDLIKMIEMKKNNEIPSDYLVDKLDNMLINIGK